MNINFLAIAFSIETSLTVTKKFFFIADLFPFVYYKKSDPFVIKDMLFFMKQINFDFKQFRNLKLKSVSLRGLL